MYNPVHQEQFSAGDTTENFADFVVGQEQVLVPAIPRLVGSSPPVDEFTSYVARRPLPLVEVQPSVRAQRHIVEDLGEIAPLVQILDLPVSQMVDSVTDILRLLDRPIAEQVIAVPTVSCSSCPLRPCVPEPQLADQLVEVPTVLTPTRIALQIAEQIVDTPASRGRVHGSLPGQSSATPLPESIEWVELSDANGRPWFWNRRSQAVVRKAPPGVQVVWVGVKDEEGGTWYWHRRTPCLWLLSSTSSSCVRRHTASPGRNINTGRRVVFIPSTAPCFWQSLVFCSGLTVIHDVSLQWLLWVEPFVFSAMLGSTVALRDASWSFLN